MSSKGSWSYMIYRQFIDRLLWPGHMLRSQQQLGAAQPELWIYIYQLYLAAFHYKYITCFLLAPKDKTNKQTDAAWPGRTWPDLAGSSTWA